MEKGKKELKVEESCHSTKCAVLFIEQHAVHCDLSTVGAWLPIDAIVGDEAKKVVQFEYKLTNICPRYTISK
jgi:hypothetical protein